MPFSSEAQRRFMYWAEKEGKVPKGTVKKWEEHTKKKNLPEKVKKALENPVMSKFISLFDNNEDLNDENNNNLLKVVDFYFNKLDNDIYKTLTMELEEDMNKSDENVGKHNFVSDDVFNPMELKAGIAVELEHTSDPELAKKIAKDHLMEIPDYYSRLLKMEKDAKQEEKKQDISKGGEGSGRHKEALMEADEEEERLRKISNGRNVHRVANVLTVIYGHKEEINQELKAKNPSEAKLEEQANKLLDYIKNTSKLVKSEYVDNDLEKSLDVIVNTDRTSADVPVSLRTNIEAMNNKFAEYYINRLKDEVKELDLYEPKDFNIESENGLYNINISKSSDNMYKGVLRNRDGINIMEFDNQTPEIIGNMILTKIGMPLNNQELMDDDDIIEVSLGHNPLMDEIIDEIVEEKIEEKLSEKRPSINVSVSPEGQVDIEIKKSKENNMNFSEELVKALDIENEKVEENLEKAEGEKGEVEDVIKPVNSKEDKNDSADDSMEPSDDSADLDYVGISEYDGGKQYWYKDKATGRIYEKDNAPEEHEDYDSSSSINELKNKISALEDQINKLTNN